MYLDLALKESENIKKTFSQVKLLLLHHSG